jgi:hypothetical protein
VFGTAFLRVFKREYDPETGYKIHNAHTQAKSVSDTENTNTVNDPGLISAQGSLAGKQNFLAK